MRKALACIIVLSIILASLFIPALSYGVPVFSTDAIRQYCNIWNDYYRSYDSMLECGYSLSDDNQTVKYMSITYNGAEQEANYNSEVIPSTAYLHFLYSTVDDVFGFCVFSDDMKSDLENAVFYTDDRVINNAIIGSSHDPNDMWSISLYGDDVLYLFSLDHFTIKFTINGKSEIVDISKDKDPYLYDMVFWLIGVQLYSDTTYENYRSSAYLPGGASATDTPEAIPQNNYSFREDYEKVDLAAKSLFYVETYDKQFNVLSSASGFVSFDEHLFITNQHVIEDASYLKVWDDDDNMYIIDKVAMSDKEHDLAILLFPEGESYNALEQGGEDELKRGQPVVTIGSPKGFQNTVAYGNISAFPVMEGMKYIQFTAPISHGSSGGCLFDDNGKVIGVTSAGNEEGQNLNFAIPIKHVQDLYAQWDKSSYEPLGTKRSWNMVGITPTPSPTPSPVPTPTPTPSPTPEPTVKVTIGKQTRSGTYTGDENNGIPQGYGVFDSTDSKPALHYEGNWNNGTASGKGVMKDSGFTIHFNTVGQGKYDKTGVYEGDTVDGIPNGKGKYITKNSADVTWTYTGDFAEGTFNGYGEIVWETENSSKTGNYSETGNYTNGEYTPTWSQLISTMGKDDGYSIYDSSLAFIDDNESLFITNEEIDPNLIYKDWDVSAFTKSPSDYCSKLTCEEDLTVVQADNITGYNREFSFLILENSKGVIFYGYIDEYSNLHADISVDLLYLLPLNWVKYKNANDQDREAVFCSFVRMGNYEAEPTPTPTPVPTPTPTPTPVPTPTAAPTSTPQAVNHGSGSIYKIALEENEITVYIDNPVSVIPKVVLLENDQAKKGIKYTWSSSDPTIVEVDKDTIKGIAEGDAVLTCALEEDESVYTLLFVHVKTPITAITSEETLELISNDDGKNTYTIRPLCEPEGATYDELTFVSSSPKVITINEMGEITALAPGNATITVTANIRGAKKPPKCTIKVKVVKKIETISKIEPKYELIVNKSLTLSPVIEPKDATNKKLSWKSSNESIATVSANGMVKAIKAGTCKITASAMDGGGAQVVCSITVIQPVTAMKTVFDSKDPYTGTVGEEYDLSSAFYVEPYNATVKDFDISVYENGKKLEKGNLLNGNYSLTGKTLTFKRAGKFKVTASSKDGTNKEASVILLIRPKDRNTLGLPHIWWDKLNNSNSLKVSYEITNEEYGEYVTAVELYVYATDAWGNDIYNGKKYNGTTSKSIAPGGKIRSEWITIPNLNKINTVYCGVHKIRFSDGTTVTIDNINYYHCTID